MKKRLIIRLLIPILAFVIIGVFIFIVSRPQHLVPQEFFSILPSQPLAYMQCVDLEARVEQLRQNSRYQGFLESPFFQQLQKIEGWQEFSASFEAFWEGMVIDPMRLIGTDVSIGLYQAEKDELWPAAILLSRVDRTAKIAERGLYIFDQLFGQLGIESIEKIEAVPVYKVHHEEMQLPIYYTIVGDLMMVSTSLPLLQDTIQRAIGEDQAEATDQENDSVEKASLFTQILQTVPASRALTFYLEPALLLKEFSTNHFFRSLNLDHDPTLRNMADFTPMSLFLDTYAGHIRLKAELYPISYSANRHKQQAVSDVAVLEESNEKTDENQSCSSDKNDWGGFPIVAQVDKESLAIFIQKLHTLFPDREWTSPLQGIDLQHDIFGERVTCRLSNTLFGTLYPVPDLLCLSETPKPPQSAIPVLDKIVDGLLTQSFTPIARRTMIRQVSESYLDMVISKVQLMFQEIFSYTVFAVEKQRSWMLLTTNSELIKKRFDQFQTYPDESLYPCLTAPIILVDYVQANTETGDSKEDINNLEIPAGKIWIQPERLAKFIEDLTGTQTFSLLVPQQNYPELYQQLPELLLFLQALPPIFVDYGIQGEKLFTALWLESSSQE